MTRMEAGSLRPRGDGDRYRDIGGGRGCAEGGRSSSRVELRVIRTKRDPPPRPIFPSFSCRHRVCSPPRPSNPPPPSSPVCAQSLPWFLWWWLRHFLHTQPGYTHKHTHTHRRKREMRVCVIAMYRRTCAGVSPKVKRPYFLLGAVVPIESQPHDQRLQMRGEGGRVILRRGKDRRDKRLDGVACAAIDV